MSRRTRISHKHPVSIGIPAWRMRPMGNALLVVAVLVCLGRTSPFTIRMNHLQVLHAHNSYRQCPADNMLALFRSPLVTAALRSVQSGSNGESYGPDAWSYEFPPYLNLVRDFGVRSIEMDLAFDDVGGRYAYRAGPKLARLLGATNDSTGQRGPPEYDTPGWKVAHVPDLDFRSNCATATQCLSPLVAWSAANPMHDPIFIVIEMRFWSPLSSLGAVGVTTINSLLRSTPDLPTSLSSSPTPNASHVDVLEAELLTIFKRSQLFTPQDFRAGYATKRKRLDKLGWPPLSQLRGKFVLVGVGHSTYLDALQPARRIIFAQRYIGEDAPDVIFLQTSGSDAIDSATIEQRAVIRAGGAANATAAQRAAAVQLRNSLVSSYLTQMTASGKYMVRIFGDSNTEEARASDTSYFPTLLASGTHFLHTDYPNGLTSQCGFTSPYTVALRQATPTPPNAWFLPPSPLLSSACNPISAPKDCRVLKPGASTLPPACTCFNVARKTNGTTSKL